MEKQRTDIEGEWEELLRRALASLDEQAAERLEKCRAVAAKKMRRMGLSEIPVDKGAVKEFLLEYAKLKNRYGLCVKKTGVDVSDLVTAYDLWPETKFVVEYLKKLRAAAREMANEDRLDDALEGLDRLNTEEDCKLSAKSVLFTVGALDREHFGDDVGGEAKRGRSQVTYVIPNLTVNNIYSPTEVAERAKRQLGGEVVDVEAEGEKVLLAAGGSV